MAIVKMTKVMIITHRSQAAPLLEALQQEGICQILNTQEAIVSKNLPQLATATEPPKDIEQLLNRLSNCIEFLKNYGDPTEALVSVFAPRVVVDEQTYNQVIGNSNEILKTIDYCEQIESTIKKLTSDCETLKDTLKMLHPWQALQTPVEQIGQLQQTNAFIGLLPRSQFKQIEENLGQLAAAIQQIGTTENKYACLIVCLKENIDEVQKLLRSADFEQVNFVGPYLAADGTIGPPAPMKGTPAQLINQYSQKLKETEIQLQMQIEKATLLSENLLNLEILHDHYENLLSREHTKTTAPATQSTVILEGWVKEKDYKRLQTIVSRFQPSSLSKIEPTEDEEVPVEIENNPPIRPFEVITRLYGMPRHFNVDPTVFLAPFFALFFALCLTDAGYGLVIIALIALFIKKIQGDRKLMWMLGICAVTTVIAGALTGGWFGDAIQQFIPALKPLREKLMWFDPLENPMTFFKLALALGYLQIMTGLLIAFVHNLKQGQLLAAVCDQLTWLVMLNSIVILLASKAGLVSAQIGSFFGKLALIPAGVILLFSHRQGSWIGRIGMGLYNLFSAIFYMGDVLSYLRLMALGMVTAGLAMAINVIAKIAGQIPYGIGIIAMILVLVGGHLFNLAINALGAFVHTLRLQYVEFFPKFLIGGGKEFQPLTTKYKHIYIKPNIKNQNATRNDGG